MHKQRETLKKMVSVSRVLGWHGGDAGVGEETIKQLLSLQ
jgi:hypothetical protein